MAPGPVDAAGTVDAQTAPTAPWKTPRVFHELPQGLLSTKSSTDRLNHPQILLRNHKLDLMRNKIPHPPELAKFRTLYLDFAKTMLEMTNNQYMDDGAEKLLIQEYQFSRDDYTKTARYSAAHEQFIPLPNNDAFPHSVARKCADAFYSSGLASGFRLSDNAGTPIENPSLEQLRPHIIHMHLDRPIRHLVRWAISHGQRNNSASFSDGFIQPRVCRGRSLSTCATRFRCRWLWTDKSVPLGKY